MVGRGDRPSLASFARTKTRIAFADRSMRRYKNQSYDRVFCEWR
jgi:hypothetical protein